MIRDLEALKRKLNIWRMMMIFEDMKWQPADVINELVTLKVSSGEVHKICCTYKPIKQAQKFESCISLPKSVSNRRLELCDSSLANMGFFQRYSELLQLHKT